MKIANILQPQVDALVRNVTQLTWTPDGDPAAYDCVRKQISGELVRKQDLTVITAAMGQLEGQPECKVLNEIVTHCCETFYLPDRVLSVIVVPVAFRMKSRMDGQVVIGEGRKRDLELLASMMVSHTQGNKVIFDTRLYDGAVLYGAQPNTLLNFLTKLEAGEVRPEGGPPACVLRSEAEPTWRVVYFVGVEVTDQSSKRSLNTETTQRLLHDWQYVPERALQECDAVIFNRVAVAQAKSHGAWYLSQGLQVGESVERGYKLQSLLANFEQGVSGVQLHYIHDKISSSVRLLVSSQLMTIEHKWDLYLDESLDGFLKALDTAIDLMIPAVDVVAKREVDAHEYRQIASANRLGWLLEERVSNNPLRGF